MCVKWKNYAGECVEKKEGRKNKFGTHYILIVILRCMGLTKTDLFTKQQNELASMAKALAHPARIAILEILINKNTCICGDIVEELPLSQATVSQHLKELKEAGIIQGEISGVRTCYCIDPKVWNQAGSLLSQLFASYKMQENCC